MEPSDYFKDIRQAQLAHMRAYELFFGLYDGHQDVHPHSFIFDSPFD